MQAAPLPRRLVWISPPSLLAFWRVPSVTRFMRKMGLLQPSIPKKALAPAKSQVVKPFWRRSKRQARPASRWAGRSACKAIHGAGQFDVQSCQAACIMGGQNHFDTVVNVEPFGVMIQFLRL